jgi:hypothetical protein
LMHQCHALYEDEQYRLETYKEYCSCSVLNLRPYSAFPQHLLSPAISHRVCAHYQLEHLHD